MCQGNLAYMIADAIVARQLITTEGFRLYLKKQPSKIPEIVKSVS